MRIIMQIPDGGFCGYWDFRVLLRRERRLTRVSPYRIRL